MNELRRASRAAARWRGAAWAGLLVGILAGLLLGGDARADQSMEIKATVVKISDEPGPIHDSKIHEKLRKQFRYESLQVLDSRSFTLAIDQVGQMAMANGRLLQMKPLLVDERGALLSVDVEGTLKTDVRVKSGHLVVLGAGNYDGGQLVISLDARF